MGKALSGAAGAKGAQTPAESLPIARVAVDTQLAHLDRPFDYLIASDQSDAVTPGCRVRVRFSGRLVDGFVLERVERSEHDGRLAYLARVVSPEPVLSAEIIRLARAVADRCAGTLADVLRLAVPPRHARVEKEPAVQPVAEEPDERATGWSAYPEGPSFLDALKAGGSPRAVWWALAGPGWPAMIADAVAATVKGGRGAVVVVPDARDLDRVTHAVAAAIGAGGVVALSAEVGPAERYRRYLAVRRGQVRVVVGTRAAAFAPVENLGLVAIWDDGDDLHAEPHAPYPHVRDVLVLRAHQVTAAVLIGGWSPSVEAGTLVRQGWARALRAPREVVRDRAPRVEATGSDTEMARDPAARAARLPSLAWRVSMEALAAGAPVLLQVPRRGYLPALACATCRRPARCVRCSGPLGQDDASGRVSCRWCGRPAADWHCPSCDGRSTRAVVVGARRTAEELGRAFPGAAVRTSGRDLVLPTVPAEPALVVATPGAEPIADGGYGAVVLLDAWALLGRPDLRAAEETLRRWCAAAALARPASGGGRVIVTADASIPVVQALVRWDPGGFTYREADERVALAFPPATRIAAIEGPAADVADFLAAVEVPAGGDVLGPVPAGDGERALIRVPRREGNALAAACKAAAGARSARKAAPVRVHLDPPALL